MGKYQELLVPKGKTWREALEYYHNFFKTDLYQYIDIEDGLKDELHKLTGKDIFVLEDLHKVEDVDSKYLYDLDLLKDQYQQNSPTDIELLKEIDREFNLDLPEELIDLYVNHGSFSIYNDELFEVFEPKKRISFADSFGNYDYENFFVRSTDTLSEEQYAELQKRFFFWGIGFFESAGRSVMFFYDKEKKKFGEIMIMLDEPCYMKIDDFPKLFEGDFSKHTLDELFVLQIDRILLRALTSSDNQLMTPNDVDEEDSSFIGKWYL